MYILAGDIGGTKSHLGIFQRQTSKLQLIHEKKLASQNFSSLISLLTAFFDNSQIPLTDIKAACLGVAGPVYQGQCHITNLSWTIQQNELQNFFNCKEVYLINDLEAVAYGVLYTNVEYIDINPYASTTEKGNIAIITLGTGFGLAILAWEKQGECFFVLPTESGHTNFAPRNQQHLAFLDFLLKQQQKTVYDNILSGSGLKMIYSFFCKQNPKYVCTSDFLQKEDFTKVLIEKGLKKQETLCEATINFFAALCASKIADIALEHLTLNGIYLGGGIAPAILPKLQETFFLESFLDKPEKFAALLKQIPIKVLTNPEIGMLGAAHYIHTGEYS
ncbi:ROK family protein [Beggiatoa leptomitoformis]|uniref:ROK family protein n=1 Tax=Beggiatoa leptomitoformis TaxID=288004 RepID=A0A2N9YB90_9GAMM|nr:ROK family protein [Beggiatoa leptomitoformis]ALG66894.1 ROK family protein [Beggiatoa leptomitoformis]AUI67747.2 ROK family protein [Beggiatoa leptomitoformis]